VNTPGNPVPITGTVTLQGGVGTISGSVRSADQNVTLYENFIQVTSVVDGNAGTPLVPVKDYKEVRLAVQRGSCGPCSDPVMVSVYVRGSGGTTYQIDQFPVSEPAAGVGFFASRTYTTPGEMLAVGLRNSSPGNNTVRVLLVGRSN
jgi:hypothetical protein